MSKVHKITIAKGDGIGPEIFNAVLRVVEKAGAKLDYDEIEIGEAAFLKGHESGIPPEEWSVLRKNPIFLKAPITTPSGKGYKSLNVTIRKALNLFANVRPTQSNPYFSSYHKGVDLVIIRENEEDLYAGIEHQQTPEVAQALKLVTRPGTERICRYAFEYAKLHGRQKVTCMTKDNIMKITDGMFHSIFNEISSQYPEIKSDHQIIDIGAAKLADRPQDFDVVVTLNLYGDILSDIASQVTGSVGVGSSVNIGPSVSMFEAVHGSAPDIAGKGIANPSGLLLAAVQMLAHLGELKIANSIKNAWLCALEDQCYTGDVLPKGLKKAPLTTEEFADEVINRLGNSPKKAPSANYVGSAVKKTHLDLRAPQQKVLVGTDVFIDWSESNRNPEVLGSKLSASCPDGWTLKMITNRGVKVYPDGIPETFCTDHWRCRFITTQKPGTQESLITLFQAINKAKLDIIKTENLYEFDGQRAYSLGQGE